MVEIYEYEVQISTTEEMPEWIHEVIGQSFHCVFRSMTEIHAKARIERLKEAGFEIDYARRRRSSAYEDVTF